MGTHIFATLFKAPPGGHKAKEKGMIFILIFSNFMKIEIVRKCASHCRREALFLKLFENVSDAKQSLPKRQFSARVAKNTIFQTLQGEGSASPGRVPDWIDRWMWAVG